MYGTLAAKKPAFFNQNRTDLNVAEHLTGGEYGKLTARKDISLHFTGNEHVLAAQVRADVGTFTHNDVAVGLYAAFEFSFHAHTARALQLSVKAGAGAQQGLKLV